MEILNRKLSEWENKISQIYPINFIKAESAFETFAINYTKDKLQIRYSDLNTAIFAAKKIWESIRDKNLFPKGTYQAKSHWRIIDPLFFEMDENLLTNMIEDGFNAVILKAENHKLKEEVKKWGLKVILDITFPDYYCDILPFDKTYFDFLKKFISSFKEPYDALYWKSPYFNYNCKTHLLENHKLMIELYIQEIQSLEELKPVFYLIPHSKVSNKQLNVLAGHAGPSTFLVYPIQGEEYPAQRTLPHLESLEDSVSLIFSEENRQMIKKTNAGAVICVDKSWKEGSFYSCHMASLGAALWGISTYEECTTKWIKFNRPELNIEKDNQLLVTLGRFASLYYYFKRIKNEKISICVEEFKMLIERMNSEKKLLQYHLELAQKRQNGGTFFSEIESHIESFAELSK